MIKLAFMLVIAAQVMLSACASLRGSDSMILRRYATQSRVSESAPSVKITVFALAVPPPKSSVCRARR